MRSLTLQCDTCPLRPAGVFGRLSAEQVRELDRSRVAHELAPGQTVFSEGAPALAVHCIHAGLVKITKLGPRGEEQIIRVLGPGEIVGYRAVLAGETYSATAQAIEATTVCTIPAAVLMRLLRLSPELAFDMLAKLARELRISEDTLIDLGHRKVRQRLAAVLQLLAERIVDPGGRAASGAVHLQRRDLARLIATTPESVSRALRRFAAEGTVECTRTEVRVLDAAALKRVAGSALQARLDGHQAAP